MKIKLTYFCFFCFLFSCSTESKTKKTYDWIREHEKPITVKLKHINSATFSYILVDKDSNVYNTGEVDLILPDVIN